MKKSILTLAVLATATFASAQESGAFKPVAGNKTLEFQFAPLGGSPIGINGIQFRSFSSDKSAIRANIFLGFTNHSEVTDPAVTGPAGSNSPELKTKESSFEIGIAPGIEKHMAGTDRLSPYMGLVLDLGFKSSKKEVERFGTPESNGDISKVESHTTKGEDGFIRLGLMVPIGFDYYVAKSLYMGAEMGIGVGFTKGSTIKEEDTVTPDPAPTVITDDQKGDSDINFGPTVNAKIRLGFAF